MRMRSPRDGRTVKLIDIRESTELKKLLLRTSSEESLPRMPEAAISLFELIEREAPLTELERTVLTDPALTASILRAASSAFYAAQSEPITQVGRALTVIGSRGAKSVAFSLLMYMVANEGLARTLISPKRYAHHCSFVGMLSKYLFERNTASGEVHSDYTADQVFTAGVLHDIGIGVLAVVDPDQFRTVVNIAENDQIGMERAFEMRLNAPLSLVTYSALKKWGVPGMYGEMVFNVPNASQHPKEAVALMCIQYANFIAEQGAFPLLERAPIAECEPETLERIGLADDELNDIVSKLSRQAVALPAAA